MTRHCSRPSRSPGFVGEGIRHRRDSGKMRGIVSEADLFNLYLTLQNRIADLERRRSIQIDAVSGQIAVERNF